MENAAQIITAIAAQLKQASELSTVADELAVQLAQLRGTGSSDGREVTVTVDHQGIPLDIVVRDEALGYDGGQVSAMVLTATERAIEDVKEQAEPLRAAMLQPHAMPPMQTDLSDKIHELYTRIEEFDRATGGGRGGSATPDEGGRA